MVITYQKFKDKHTKIKDNNNKSIPPHKSDPTAIWESCIIPPNTPLTYTKSIKDEITPINDPVQEYRKNFMESEDK